MRTLLAACLLASIGHAQTFAVASIKAANPDTRGYSIRPLPGRLVAQNVTLAQLIAEAWHVYDFQVSGGPKWVVADRFDVEGKAAGDNPTRAELRAMLQNLLEERFGLRVRHEAKDAAVLVLVTARGGSKLQPPKDPAAPAVFRIFQRRQVTSQNAPLEQLTEVLTWVMGKPVVDRTALTGAFDYKLEWSPDEQQVRSGEAPPDAAGSNPSLVAALQQQLGLRLIARREPVEAVIVESAARPAVN